MIYFKSSRELKKLNDLISKLKSSQPDAKRIALTNIQYQVFFKSLSGECRSNLSYEDEMYLPDQGVTIYKTWAAADGK